MTALIIVASILGYGVAMMATMRIAWRHFWDDDGTQGDLFFVGLFWPAALIYLTGLGMVTLASRPTRQERLQQSIERLEAENLDPQPGPPALERDPW